MLNSNKNYKKGQLITFKHNLLRICLVKRMLSFDGIKTLIFVRGINPVHTNIRIIIL